MTETESLIAEIRQLRADVARLHAAHTAVHIRHGWMKLLFKDLSTNPYTQYKVHMWGAIYWLINFPLICCLFFFTPRSAEPSAWKSRRRRTTSSSWKPYSSSTDSPPGVRPWDHASPSTRRFTSSIPV
jgi:hypothetical protein